MLTSFATAAVVVDCKENEERVVVSWSILLQLARGSLRDLFLLLLLVVVLVLVVLVLLLLTLLLMVFWLSPALCVVVDECRTKYPLKRALLFCGRERIYVLDRRIAVDDSVCLYSQKGVMLRK